MGSANYLNYLPTKEGEVTVLVVRNVGTLYWFCTYLKSTENKGEPHPGGA